MSNYLTPTPDTLSVRSFGHWSTEKLYYLREYLKRFTKAMCNQPWRNFRYIDLFAGTGKLHINDTDTYALGSPLLALTAPQQFSEYVFVECDAGSLNALSTRCAAAKTKATVHFINDDCNVYVSELANRIKAEDDAYIPGKYSSLNLAFLDPDGLELHWDTVATLAQIRKMDLVIHYSQGGLNRMLKKTFLNDKNTVVDQFFGDREWRNIYQQYRIDANRNGLHRELMDYYKSKLRALGYIDVRSEDETGIEPLMRNSKQAPLYRLMFASKHELGHKFWNSATRKTPSGQKRLF